MGKYIWNINMELEQVSVLSEFIYFEKKSYFNAKDLFKSAMNTSVL